MQQQSFTDIEYSNRRRKTRRDEFLEEMNASLPWAEWEAMIRPLYPSGKRGRRPRGIEIMLRMYLLQQWFRLSGEGAEDAIYDSYAMRSFLNIDFITEQAPSATTLARFRRLIAKNHLDEKIREDIDNALHSKGLSMQQSTIGDIRLISYRRGK